VDLATARARTDWRDTVSNASSIAVVGIATTIAALPVVTAGAAFATASAAIHDFCEYGAMPPIRTSARRFGRALAPGLLATAAALGMLVLIVLDVRALIAGRVPGGPVMLAVTAAAGVALFGLAGWTVVEVGRRGGRGWLPATRLAVLCGLSRPAPVAGMGLALVLAVLLAAFIPATTPILVGFALFALHAIARRAGGGVRVRGRSGGG
jgi:hypothetical protein